MDAQFKHIAEMVFVYQFLCQVWLVFNNIIWNAIILMQHELKEYTGFNAS